MVDSEPKKMTMKERMAMFNAGSATTVETTQPKPAAAPKKKIDTSWMNKQNEATAQSAVVTENKPNMFKQQIQQQKAATAAPVKKPEPVVKEEVKKAPVVKPEPKKVEEVKEERPAPQKRGKLDTSWLNKGNSATEVVIPDNKPKVTAPAKTNTTASWIKNEETKKEEEPKPAAKPAAKKIDTSWMQNKPAAQSEALPVKKPGGLAAKFAAQ